MGFFTKQNKFKKGEIFIQSLSSLGFQEINHTKNDKKYLIIKKKLINNKSLFMSFPEYNQNSYRIKAYNTTNNEQKYYNDKILIKDKNIINRRTIIDIKQKKSDINYKDKLNNDHSNLKKK